MKRSAAAALSPHSIAPAASAAASRMLARRHDPRYIRTERGVGYIFGAPVETVY